VDWQVCGSSKLRPYSRAKSSEFLSASYGTTLRLFADSDISSITRRRLILALKLRHLNNHDFFSAGEAGSFLLDK